MEEITSSRDHAPTTGAATPQARARVKKPAKLTLVEQRVRAGARIIAEMTGDLDRPVAYTFADNGKAARADIVQRLIEGGVLASRDDGLFPGCGQTWELAR